MPESMCGRVLLVDDDPNVLKSLSKLLESEGFSARTCPDAFAALEFAESERFDVVLSDVKMPAVSGLELLDHIQRLDPDIPVVLMTGYSETGTAIAALKRHAFDFILKPIQPEMLMSILARALNYRRLRAAERGYAGLLESTVVKNTEELKIARDVAEESSKLKSEFMANISHEIRTPLNGMVGLIELLTGLEHTAEQDRYYDMLKSSTGRLSYLLNNLIEFSKMASGSFELTETEFGLSDLVVPLVRSYSDKAAAKNLTMSYIPDSELPDRLVGDEARLRQVLYHVLENSIKFTSEGRIEFRTSILEKADSAERKEVFLLFTVSDTGIGIAPEKMDTIFDGFRQADGSSTRKHEGAGLGLAIARQTIRSMGGEIWVESRQGSGSTFYFTLPVKRRRDHETADC
jgi:two-component system, sensor histidine kinase